MGCLALYLAQYCLLDRLPSLGDDPPKQLNVNCKQHFKRQAKYDVDVYTILDLLIAKTGDCASSKEIRPVLSSCLRFAFA